MKRKYNPSLYEDGRTFNPEAPSIGRKIKYFLDITDQYKNSKQRATPKWLSKGHKQAIEAIYKECQGVTEETGLKHHVDHIIPLRGKTVSGLHVPWNLQILLASDNCKKKNSI